MKRTIIGIIIIMTAVLTYCYPTISSLYNSYIALKTIAKTTDYAVTETQDYEAELEKCIAYNETLAKGVSVISSKMNEENKTYESLLNIGNTGIMGYIEIPVISQKLPIYHYTEDEELSRGIGHISTSSLPVGGSGTNCILTGHRGLPNNLLFTRLDEVTIGDMVYITTLNDTKAYKVYDIETILPEETSGLTIEEDKDIVTLITCTPYGVNTHRLVIRAERVSLDEETYEPVTETDTMLKSIPFTRFYISGAFILGLIVLSVLLKKRGAI